MMRAPAAPALPDAEVASPRSYATAVVLSSLLGFVGLQHFYLGRWWQGWVDVALTLGWISALAAGEVLLAIALAATDFGHALYVTVQLFTGNCRDGEGRIVCYPGQKLHASQEVHTSWKPS